ncbi:MAG: hypothetical protein M1272_02030, partial [Firmicutes bacterium]|nr:hypothetical protein [Bacillota bacterium]
RSASASSSPTPSDSPSSSASPRRFAVVGAGPAGMSFAIEAARRHNDGRLFYLAIPPGTYEGTITHLGRSGIAGRVNQLDGVRTRPERPVTNMFHVHFARPKGEMEPILARVYQETGVGFVGALRDFGKHASYFELSLGDLYETVPRDSLRRAFRLLDEALSERV